MKYEESFSAQTSFYFFEIGMKGASGSPMIYHYLFIYLYIYIFLGIYIYIYIYIYICIYT